MNRQEKQELIEKLHGVGGCGADPETWARGYDDGISVAIDIVEQLDEPQKPVAKLAKHWHEDEGDVLWWNFPITEPPYCGTPLDDNFPSYKTHFTKIEVPEEVEKEPLYYVVFDILQSQKYLVKNIKTETFYLSNNENVIGNYEQVSFTETEIKAIDERYWAFAVPVDEVEEG